MYLPLGNTITESNSNKNTSTTENGVEDQSQIKRGNPGKMDLGPFSSENASMTCYNSKQKPEYDSWDGGKIAEQANARSNSLDTGTEPRTRSYREGARKLGGRAPAIRGLLNSVSLNEVPLSLNGCRGTVRDLFGVRQESTLTLTHALLTLEEKVEIKQRELVQLAKLKGVCDKKVLDRQLILVRSLLFREHAVDLMRRKPGSHTPGVDKEFYDKEDEQMFVELVGYLRMITYHPNQYKADPVRRV